MKNFFRDDRGDSAVTVAIFMSVVIITAVLAISNSSLSATASSRAASHANQMTAAVESALSHAAWKLNDSPRATNGAGNMGPNSDVTWTWRTISKGPNLIELAASATMGDRTVERTAKLKSVQVAGAEKVGESSRYAAGVKLASSYIVAGSDINLVKPSWATLSTYLDGRIGVFDGVAKPKLHLQAAPSNGVDSYVNINSQKNAGTVNHAGVPMIISGALAKQKVEECNSLRSTWKSSEQGSRIVGGTTVCADLVIIDSPTSVTGTGIATIKAKKLVVRSDISTSAANQLRAWVDGNVDFDLAAAGADKTLQVADTHVYAGAGTCRTLNVSAGHGLKFTGSLACKRVDATGSFSSSAAKPVSETTYPVWVLQGE